MRVKDCCNLTKYVLIAAALTGFGIFLYACEKMMPANERHIMEATEKTAVTNIAIPPIDRSAPLKTETATFALG